MPPEPKPQSLFDEHAAPPESGSELEADVPQVLVQSNFIVKLCKVKLFAWLCQTEEEMYKKPCSPFGQLPPWGALHSPEQSAHVNPTKHSHFPFVHFPWIQLSVVLHCPPPTDLPTDLAGVVL